MNRRGFLKSLAAAAVAAVAVAVLPPIPTPIFSEFVEPGAVGDFVVYYQWQGELLCSSPRLVGVITGISE